MTSFVLKKMRKKDVVGTVTFDPPITLLLILQWLTGVCEETVQC